MLEIIILEKIAFLLESRRGLTDLTDEEKQSFFSIRFGRQKIMTSTELDYAIKSIIEKLLLTLGISESLTQLIELEIQIKELAKINDSLKNIELFSVGVSDLQERINRYYAPEVHYKTIKWMTKLMDGTLTHEEMEQDLKTSIVPIDKILGKEENQEFCEQDSLFPESGSKQNKKQSELVKSASYRSRFVKETIKLMNKLLNKEDLEKILIEITNMLMNISNPKREAFLRCFIKEMGFVMNFKASKKKDDENQIKLASF